MRVLVTGSRGRVGMAAVTALVKAGHDVTGTDLGPPRHDLPLENGARYVRADLTDAGDAYAVVRGHDAVAHCAAIPNQFRDTPEAVFSTNVVGTFNVAEAAVAFGARRLVNLSSAVVCGYTTSEPAGLPDYLPADEDEPVRPAEPYALSKHVGEQVMDMTARRSALRCISLRPSWVQRPQDYEANLGPGLRVPHGRISRWSYLDVRDLASAVVAAIGSELPGHEVFHVAAADNALGIDTASLVSRFYGDRIPLRPLPRPDAGAVSCAKAHLLLGWQPRHGWRDHLSPGGTPLVPDTPAVTGERPVVAGGTAAGTPPAHPDGPATAGRP